MTVALKFRHRIGLLVVLAAAALVTVTAVALVLGRHGERQLAGIETRYVPLVELDRDLKTQFAQITHALENAARKISYQFEQLAERTRKAAERKGDVTTNRRQRLSRSLLPSLDSIPAERVYTPLSAMLAFGKTDVLDAFRRVAGTGAAGAAFVDLGLTEAEKAAGPGKEEAGKEEDAHAR